MMGHEQKDSLGGGGKETLPHLIATAHEDGNRIHCNPGHIFIQLLWLRIQVTWALVMVFSAIYPMAHGESHPSVA